jgi:methyl-accepting chemotaxis protein
MPTMKLSDYGIGTRLAAGISAVLLIAAALLGVSLWSSARERATTSATLKAAFERAELAQVMHQALLRTGIAARNMGLQTTVDGVNAAEAAAKQAQASYQGYKAQLEQSGLSDAGKVLFAELLKLTSQSDKHFQEAVGLAQQFNTEQAAAIIAKKIDPLMAQTEDVLKRFAELQRGQSLAALEDAEQSAARTVMVLLLVGGGALAVAAAIGWRLARSIVGPLRQAVEMAQRVAEGDLTRRAEVVGRDETATLLKALNGMNDSLAKVVSQVRQCSDGIATGSAEIASGNSDLSARTEQQAASLQQTAASMDELSSTVSQNAGNAQQASQLAQGACDVAVRGGQVVAEVVSTMKGISDSSRRIADIIGTIDGIAFQTNILALNAAVEAARAGVQGRGFAVVASEVRSLAQRSAEAAREIKVLIATSVERVERGNAQVMQAGSTMADIVGAIRRVNDFIAEISVASQQQSQGVSQVGQAVSLMDRATQQNAALVEESAAAAESLRQQAARLVEAVAVFKLGADAGHAGADPAVTAATQTLPAGASQIWEAF